MNLGNRTATKAVLVGMALWVLGAAGVVGLGAGCASSRHASRLAAAPVPAVGAPAPEFGLPDQDGNTVRLADLSGRWVVLYFYPGDDTPGCTAEATEFTQLLGEFETMNAVVIGVSADPPLSHRFFIAKHGLGITLLSDEGRQAMRSYGCWREVEWQERTLGRIIRTTFIIDPAGRIAWRWDHVVPSGHAEQVHQKLQEMGADRATAAR